MAESVTRNDGPPDTHSTCRRPGVRRGGPNAAPGTADRHAQPARYLGATDSLGTVADGKIADLVVLNANPLQDIRNTEPIHAVMLGGSVDRAALDRLLDQAANEARPCAP